MKLNYYLLICFGVLLCSFDCKKNPSNKEYNHGINIIPSTGFDINVTSKRSKNSIRLSIDKRIGKDCGEEQAAEAYSLSVNKNGVDLKATTLKGLFYGMATFYVAVDNDGKHGQLVEIDMKKRNCMICVVIQEKRTISHVKKEQVEENLVIR